MAQIAGKVAMFLGEKVFDAVFDKVKDKVMQEVFKEEDKMALVLSSLRDISQRIDRNYKVIQNTHFTQLANQYRAALSVGDELVVFWQRYLELRKSPARSSESDEDLLETITSSARLANTLRQFQNGLHQAAADITPLKSAFTYFWLHYEDTTNNLQFGSADLMKGLYTVLDQIYSVQAAAVYLLVILDPTDSEGARAHTRGQYKRQKDALFEEVPYGIQRAPEPPLDWNKALSDINNELLKYYSELDKEILNNTFYFRGLNQADNYLCCFYPSDHWANGTTSQLFVFALNWATVKKAASPDHTFATGRPKGSPYQTVRWQLYPEKTGSPGRYYLASVDRNTYARYEKNSQTMYEGPRDRVTLTGRGSVITFKLILSRRTKDSKDGMFFGKLVETEPGRYAQGVPGWCSSTPTTWSMAVPGSAQAVDDGWV